MSNEKRMGRVTIPTDLDAVPETLQLMERWGADALRDCDGTEFPKELKDAGAKVYATYYTTRKDNAWAKANPDEIQQCYIMTPFYTAEENALRIPLMKGISRELLKVNDHDDITRWWEVMDRTTGQPLPAAAWHYDAASESVIPDAPAAYHEYTVSFFAYPIREAKENWVTARRAILRSPIDRIGYGGYLKLACEFPEFLTYVESVCNEFRELYANIKGTTPYCSKTVAVLNCWGKTRAWGYHMVHHALYQKQNYSYAGVIEALSGAPFDVKFVSFDDIKADPKVLDDVDVLLNIGDGDTAHTGGIVWEDAEISSAIRGFVRRGGGLIGVGEPGGHPYQGRYLQLASVLGVEKETGFTLNYDKYNWDEHRDHFILADCPAHAVDFGEGKKSIFALEGTEILLQKDKEVQMAVHEYGKGRGVYISGLPYSFINNRVLHRAILWAAHDEEDLHRWFSSNYNVEVHAYVKNGKYCVVNNTYEPQDTTVYTGDGSSFALHLDANEIKWYNMEG